MKFEYKSVLLAVHREAAWLTTSISETTAKRAEEVLNKLGDEGWELVGVWPITNGGSTAQINHAIHHFKRPAANSDA